MGSTKLPWAQEGLRKAGLHLPMRSLDVMHRELCAGNEADMTNAKDIQPNSHQQAEEEIAAAEVSIVALLKECARQKHLLEGSRIHVEEETAAEVSIVALLKACATQKNLYEGSRIHADALKRGFLQKNIFIGSTLVNMYAKCGALAKAQQVFDELPVQDLVSWNTLIAGYARHGRNEDALYCFERMQQEGLSPSAVTFVYVLKACGSIGAAKKGQEIHVEIVRNRLLEKNSVLGTALVDMYAKCGALEKAQEIFEELPDRDAVSWNVLILGYAQHGHGSKALFYYERMQREGLSFNFVTLLCVLQACGSIKAIDKGKEIHAEIAREGLLGKDSRLGTALLDMYAKCGALSWAQEVFDKLPNQDVVSWNALLTGYCQHGHGEGVLIYFEQMQQESISPNSVTLLCALQACADVGAVEKGKEIHAEAVRKGLLKKDKVLGNALVDMYAKCGALAKAQEVFDELPIQDRVAWTALITGYCQQGHVDEALTHFRQMQQKGLSPDAVTYACILQACGSIGAAEMGMELHAEIVGEGLLGRDCALGSALVDMYAKCGALGKAQEVFEKLSVRNVDSWTTLITAFSQVGKHDIVVELFNKMVGEGIMPNLVTFIVLLNACSCLGLVDEGQMYYEIMSETYGIIPTLDHHRCMVDLFGRAGYFDKAVSVIKKMPSTDCLRVWFALLDACQKSGNVKLGQFAFKHTVQLDAKSAGVYSGMSNTYAAVGMQEEVDNMKAMKVEAEAYRQPGKCGWEDASGTAHLYWCSGQSQHKPIYAY